MVNLLKHALRSLNLRRLLRPGTGILCFGLFFSAGAAVPVVESVPDASNAAPQGGAAESNRAALPLRYDAYVAGIPAGEARLLLERSPVSLQRPRVDQHRDQNYRVSGTARSKGLWESIQKWRAEYSVDGVIKIQPKQPAASTPAGNSQAGKSDSQTSWALEPGHFFSLQTTPKKRREIHIEDGVLNEIKNRKVRHPRPSQTGFDLLSALFFLPPCHPELRVHTGRDGYEMRLLRSRPKRRCTYSVEDEEGGRYKMSLRYETRGSFVVPAEIAVEGPLSGRMVLAQEP